MPKGSFINITNPDDMYAINPRDFYDTYSRSGEASAAEAPATEEPTTWDNIADKAGEFNSGTTTE